MQTIDNIKSRRSRRLFLNKAVEEAKINILLDSAINAPSSRDSQPWHFVVVKDEETQKAIAALKSEGNQQHILSAPITIVVCVDTEKSPSSWAEDGVCAAMNILLSAHDIGLEAVYVSGFSRTDDTVTNGVKETLNLPEHVMPIVIIPLGYADPDEKLENKTLHDIKDVEHENKW